MSGMHFENSDTFFDFFLRLQKFSELDIYMTADWRHDSTQNIAAVSLLNPFLENQQSVTIGNCDAQQLKQLRRDCDNRYLEQLDLRFATFNKPTHEVVAEYQNWQDLRDIWLIRNEKNMVKASIPLLFDIRKREDNDNSNIFVTLFIVPSLEFYRFLVVNQSSSSLRLIKTEATSIIKEAYAWTSTKTCSCSGVA